MYFINFFKKIFKLKNIGIITWIVINLLIIISFFLLKKRVSNISEAAAILIKGIVIYEVFVTLALSPIGEMIFRLINSCKKISNPVMSNRLMSLFNEVYEKAKLKDPNLSEKIKLYMVDQPYPNAFALGRNTVCITSGLLYLNDNEIKGIFAHEFAHLLNKDTDTILLIYVGNLTALIMFMLLRGILFIVGEAFSENALNTTKFNITYTTIIGLYAKLGITLVNYSSENREFEADKFAYDLGYGKELRDALTELQREKIKPSGFVANLMSTHPETYLRIEKLNKYLSEVLDRNSSKSINESLNTEVNTDNIKKKPINNGIIFIDENIENIEKNINYQKVKNKKINILDNSTKKNNDKILYMGLFFLNLGIFGPIFLFSILDSGCLMLGLYDVMDDIMRYRDEIMGIYLYIMIIFFILLMILVLLISIKLIKENRIDKLKIINNLLIITLYFILGCAFLSLLDGDFVFIYGHVLFLISIVTTGILAFRRDVQNKKK